jgi:DNA-3-methyladenine glycosylase
MRGPLPYGLIPKSEIIEMVKPKVLSKEFFLGDVKKIAPSLLGKKLCIRDHQGSVLKAVITETEAYDGEDDLACHASKGRTPRTSVMYEDGGICYVYLCYGMHWMFNLVTGPIGYPSAVLIRGCECVSGPGRVTKKFGITGQMNGLCLGMDSGVWLEDADMNPVEIFTGPRIGVDYAGPVWANKPYRFWFSNSCWNV